MADTRRAWKRFAILGGLALAVALAAAVGLWSITAPLEDRNPPTAPPADSKTVADSGPSTPVADRPGWPESRLDGDEAKRFLLGFIEESSRRIDHASGYTATFKKRERIDGRLGPEQTLAMKVRHRPFAVYLKFLAPKAGKEVVYAEGHRGNQVIAHSGDWTRRLVPRLAVAPDSAIALADNRHPITEAGLSNLLRRLLAFRRLDLADRDAETILDRTTGADGRPALRSVHLHTERTAGRPFTRVEVVYDPETRFPIRISSYDWPADGATGGPLLAESYAYEDVRLDPPLTDLDFDPANPAYAFHR